MKNDLHSDDIDLTFHQTARRLKRSFLVFAATLLLGSTGVCLQAQTGLPIPSGRSSLGSAIPKTGSFWQQGRGGATMPSAANGSGFLGRQQDADQPVILSEFAIPSPQALAALSGTPLPNSMTGTNQSKPLSPPGSSSGKAPTEIWLKQSDGQWSTQLLLRKVVKIDGPVAGSIQVAGKAPYQVFCNGKTIAEGDATTGVQTIDVAEHLRHGDNVIAIQARRETADTPGVALRFQYHTSQSRQTIETDGTWMAARRALPLWKTHLYSDRSWEEASVVSALPVSPADLPGEPSLPVPASLSGLASASALPGARLPATPVPGARTSTESPLIVKGKNAPKPPTGAGMSLSDARSSQTTKPSASTSPTAIPETKVADAAVPATDSNNPQDASVAVAKTVVLPVPSVESSPADPTLAEKTAGRIYPATDATRLAQGQSPAKEAANAESPSVPGALATSDKSMVDSKSVVQTPYTDEGPKAEVAVTTYQDSDRETPAADDDDSIKLRVPENFVVEPVAPSSIGSLIAIEFDEFGRLIASREAGGLVRIDLTVPVGDPQRVTEICDKVSGVQGILPLNGVLYVSGYGPDGMGLYKLSDGDGDFQYENVEKFCGFTGEPGEHGPHAINLGSDRMLYVLLGNHSQLEDEPADNSLIRNFYEGDLVPRYEDPSGHAVGIKAPGGTLIRVSLDGKQKEIVAAGLRNAYDFAFNQNGEIFFHDSDMESDEGTSWYRPTQLHHLVGGGDYGWRSGWAKWRPYYPDAIAPIAQTGRSSPSGCAFYQHVQFPAEYQNTLFLADWSNGRVVSATLKRDGARYKAQLSTFMEGRPLNVTDLSVGPEDGALYIALGGRGSTGGIYRVRWTGKVAAELTHYNNAWEEVIRAPLFYSAATRQRIATLKQELSDSWDTTVRSIVTSEKNVDAYRIRGLDVLQWFGPTPDLALLGELSVTQSELVRAKVANILGTMSEENATKILIEMLPDASPLVQRCVCESLSRQNAQVPIESLLPLLESSDGTVAYVAGRLLEKQPVDQWKDQIDQTQSPERFVRLAIALMTVQPELGNSYQVLVGVNRIFETELTEAQTLDLYRVTQLALASGQVAADKIPAFVQRVAKDFPASSSILNRELVYILAYLKPTTLDEAYQEYLADESIEFVDRFHLAMHIQLAGQQMSPELRSQIIQFLEQARSRDAGGSYAHYVMQAVRNLAGTMSDDEIAGWIQQGLTCPDAALIALGKLTGPLTLEQVQQLGTLDVSLAELRDPASKDLRLGIVAVLGDALKSDSHEVQSEAAALLEQIWESDPNRRQWVALAVTGCPLEPKVNVAEVTEEENAALRLASEARTKLRPLGTKPVYANRFSELLLNSLVYLNGHSAAEVLKCLQKLELECRNPVQIRSVVLLGIQYPEVRPTVDVLLQRWSGQTSQQAEGSAESMAFWQSWFQQRFPDQLPAALPNQEDAGKWTISEIEKQLELLKGDIHSGQKVFADAQCINCHKIGNQGSSVGPDLNVVSGRFTRREILEAIVHPSQVISDQYRASIIQTDDGKVYSGIVTQLPGGKISVLDSESKRTELRKIDIVEVKPSDLSIMPGRLLDKFNAQEIVDLIRYLEAEERPLVAEGEGDSIAR